MQPCWRATHDSGLACVATNTDDAASMALHPWSCNVIRSFPLASPPIRTAFSGVAELSAKVRLVVSVLEGHTFWLFCWVVGHPTHLPQRLLAHHARLVAAHALHVHTILFAACPTGSILGVNGASCTPCQRGSYAPEGASSCTPCGDGLTTKQQAAVNASQCSSGYCQSTKLPRNGTGLAGLLRYCRHWPASRMWEDWDGSAGVAN
jgi:hypothetical protein